MLAARSPDPEGLGGVEIHLDALLSAPPAEFRVFVAYPRAGELYVESGNPPALRAVLPLIRAGAEGNALFSNALVAALVGLRADILHVHAPTLGPGAIAAAVHRTGARAIATLHDHSFACENYDLLEGGERYCGIPEDLARCDRCLEKTLGRPAGAVQEWRSAVRTLVSTIDAFVAPSEAVLEHAARIHPEIRGRARRIPWGIPPPSARATIGATSGPLRIAVVGLPKVVKGRNRLPALISAARDVGVEWHFFGATEGDGLRDVRRTGAQVFVHGAYRRPMLAARLVEAGCHAALLASIGVEAFSLTLSEIVAAGIPVIATQLGAIGERVRENRLGWTFDPWNDAEFSDLITLLDRERDRIDAAAAHVRSLERRTVGQMVNDHTGLWSELAALPRKSAPAVEPSFLESFEAGRAIARGRRSSMLAGLAAAVRRTDFYRDLTLRRMVPLSLRKRIERFAEAFLARRGRR